MQAIVKVTNSAGEEVRQFTVEVEPGKGWKKRAEEAALKLVAEDEKIQIIPNSGGAPPAENGDSADTVTPMEKFSFQFNFIKDGAEPRSVTITVQAPTREYAWRKAVDIARAKANEEETAQFAGDVGER
ncbi:MAG: hypothetical protein AB1600_11435 [Bacteroidota bacterium]